MFVLLHDTATTEIYTYRHTLSLHGALPISPRAVAVALRRSFADLGPTYVKFGQLIASSPGLLPGFLATEFRRLLDAVPPESPAKLRRVIEREPGAGVDELFATFYDAPVAAASVAAVHRATPATGDTVAVQRDAREGGTGGGG